MLTFYKGELDLGADPIPKLFLHYFFPILFSMLAVASYSAVDGYFVSRKLGDDAMSAVVVSWPIFPMMVSFSLLFGVGASTLTSFHLGKNEPSVSRTIFNSVFYFLAVTTSILGLVLYFNADNVVELLTSNLERHVKEMSTKYMEGIFIGLPAIVLHVFLDISVINDKRPTLSAMAMLTGAISNIALNYVLLFVVEAGIAGSAYATIASNCIATTILITHFILKRGELYFKKTFKAKYILNSIKYGFPQAMSELSASFTIWLYNDAISRTSGTYGLTIYSAILYNGFVYFTVMLSIAQSIQPLASFNYGTRNIKRLGKLIRFSILLQAIISIMMYLIFYVYREPMSSAFIQDSSIIEGSAEAMKVYYIGYPLLSISLLIGTFLISTQRVFSALVVTLSYSLVFEIIMVPILSNQYGLNGIWVSYPVSQAIALIVATFVIFCEFKYGTLKDHR